MQSFEPLVLMPDPAALSTPHVYRAHSYSGAAVAGMFHTNAFVENNQQFGDWQVGMAVAQYSAEMTELLPAFASRERFYPTDPPRPEVTVAAAEGTPVGEGSPYTLVAKVLTEQAPARGVAPEYFCHTLVTVNPHSTPCVAKFVLADLLAGSGLPSTVPVGQLQAQRLFHGQYLTNLTSLANGSVVLTDFVDARTANVYRIGCDTASAAILIRNESLIVGGDFETLADLGAPGHLLSIPHDPRGKPTASAYSATMSVGGHGHGNRSDDRTRITSSLSDPFNGRYSAKVNLGSSTPVRISLPVMPPSLDQQESLASPEYSFQLWVRSSPAGVKVELASVMFEIVTAATLTSATTGWGAVNATLRLKNANATVAVKNCKVPPYPPCELPLEVKLTSVLEVGGTVFLDGISLKPLA